MFENKTIHIVGGGLAGSEAAWQCAKRGLKVVLHEMRPQKTTAAHKTSNLAELVCSNSMKSVLPHTAAGELKFEMNSYGSLIIEAAYANRVPAGNALAIEREGFSQYIQEKLKTLPNFQRVSEEVLEIKSEAELESLDEVYIIATGPLTSPGLAEKLDELTGGKERLFFYDAIAPTIDGDSIDYTQCYFKDRYGDQGSGDYLNIPLTKQQYETFIEEVKVSEKVPLHSFESVSYFESCLPIEVMIDRGDETLRFGPLKPVGLERPDGSRPWAVIQLRAENVEKTMYSMVGFQTKMKWPEQKRVFSQLPGLGEAEFIRLGSIHKNTYVQGPEVLNSDLSLKTNSRVFLAGQLTGVEGYTESSAVGLLAGLFAVDKILEKSPKLPPKGCMMGALLNYVTNGNLGKFSPMNANLGLLPPIKREKGMSKSDKKVAQVKRANVVFNEFRGGETIGASI